MNASRLVSPNDCAVLVDEHVLDSYLALAALRPRRAFLMHAPAYQANAHRLAKVVQAQLGMSCELVLVKDDSSASAAHDAYAQLPAQVHLHHTGGTGGMSALVRGAHDSAGATADRASGLDEDRRLLRLDTGADVPLEQLIADELVTFDVLCALNAFVRAPDDDAAERLALVDRATQQIDWTTVNNGAGLLRTLANSLAPLQPTSGRLADHGRWHDFNRGRSFECLIATLVRQAAPGHEVIVGAKLGRDGTRTELDVIAVGRYRPYVISCATTHNGKTAKTKLFEVIVRARQVGGLTARPAVACLVDDDHAISPHDLELMGRTDPNPRTRPAVLGTSELLTALLGNTQPLSEFLSR